MDRQTTGTATQRSAACWSPAERPRTTRTWEPLQAARQHGCYHPARCQPSGRRAPFSSFATSGHRPTNTKAAIAGARKRQKAGYISRDRPKSIEPRTLGRCERETDKGAQQEHAREHGEGRGARKHRTATHRPVSRRGRLTDTCHCTRYSGLRHGGLRWFALCGVDGGRPGKR